MAIADHWILKMNDGPPNEKGRYTTVADARTAAIALAAKNPGRNVLVYRFVKAAIAPASAVEESDPA